MTSQGNSLNVSSQVNVDVDGQCSNFSGQFAGNVMQGLASAQIVQIAPGVSPLPIGPVTPSLLALLYVRNLDPANAFSLSLNADGSAPFSLLLAGLHAVLPATPGATYYAVNATASTLAAQIVAVSS